MHSRQTIHLPSTSSSGENQVHPLPLHARHRSFSAMCLSAWAIAAEHTRPSPAHGGPPLSIDIARYPAPSVTLEP